ncbi:carbamoyl phosphate synthase large subunit, partial [Candidatus Sumerlaeota bacterium]|nr:carbamoyl phosphate synthase large subunit [Candidatus Sumerlaeota bacterium]
RASRTVPLVSKVCNIAMAKIATRLMLGRKISDLGLANPPMKHFGVKEAVFPFNMFPEVDPLLGPEMRSTGEVLGMANSFGMAYFKSQEAAGQKLPTEGNVLITIADRDKSRLVELAQNFAKLGFKILATGGTHRILKESQIRSESILKVHEGRPNISDAIKNGQIHLVVNTPAGRISEFDDSYIRKESIKYKIPYITTMAGAFAAVKGIEAYRQGRNKPKCLQEYHGDIARS